MFRFHVKTFGRCVTTTLFGPSRIASFETPQDVMMHSCSFDPGLVQVPLEGNESLVLVRVS